MQDVVFPEELILFVESIRPFQLRDICSKRWLDCHEMVIKLSQQAILEASTHREECVKEHLIFHEKLKILVHEAYCALVWKTKVLPHLLEIEPNPRATFLIYTVFFHEGTVVSLLEIALFHRDGCESLKESAIDLVDYCALAVSQLIGLVSLGYHENETNIDVDESVLTEMERQKRDMIFKIGLRCISILNYLVDNIEVIPSGAARRIVSTHDIPWLLADLLEFRPWHRKSAKGIQKYIDDKWTTVTGDDLVKVVKYEVQTWFCLRQILFNNTLMEMYDINEVRRNRLLHLQGNINEILLDQLPPLIELKQYLCNISISGNKTSKKSNLILEELPEIHANLEKEAMAHGGYFIIAQDQTKIFLTPSSDEISAFASRLNTAYNTDFLAELEQKECESQNTNKHRCGVCDEAALKKCSKCKQVYYCSKKCQLSDWPEHKLKCNITEAVAQ